MKSDIPRDSTRLRPTLIQWLAVVGMVGGIFWLLLQTVLRADWGVPGSKAYVDYERFNRLWSLPLLCMALGFAGVDGWLRQRISHFPTLPIRIIWFGFVGMLIGNISEFWFLTDYPYGALNLRAYAWITFLLSMLVTIVGLALLGRATLRSLALPKWSGVMLLLALPLEIVTFSTTYITLLVTATICLVLAALILVRTQASPSSTFQVEQ